MKLFYKKILIVLLLMSVCLSGCKKAEKKVEDNSNRIYYTETDFIEDDGSAELVTDVDLWNDFYKNQKDKYGSHFSKIKSLEYIFYQYSSVDSVKYVINYDLKNYHIREYDRSLPNYSIEVLEDSAFGYAEYYIIKPGYWIPYDRVNDKTYENEIRFDKTLEFYDIALNVYDIFKASLGEFISDRGEYGGELYTLGSYYKYVSNKHPGKYGHRDIDYTLTAYFDENYDILLAFVSFAWQKNLEDNITTYVIQDMTFDRIENTVTYSDAVTEELERIIRFQNHTGAILNHYWQ